MTAELRARCRDDACGHVWTIAYLPMDIEKAARCAKNATCPKCADTKPTVAG